MSNKIADKIEEVTHAEVIKFYRQTGFIPQGTDRIVSYECWNCESRYLTPCYALATNIGKMCPKCAWDDEN